jgi:glutathione S-transferase
LASGQRVAQQHEILRLVGKETGLYPTDSLKAALVDSLMDAVEDIASKVNSQGQGLPQDEKEAARAKAVAKGGPVYGILEKVENFIATNGSGGYSVGDSLTIADLFIFASCGTLVSGLFDGIPADAIDKDFANIMAVRKAVRSNPAVTQWYDQLDSSIQMASSFGPFE